MGEGIIKGKNVSKKELKKNGFKTEIFSYYVEATFTTREGNYVFDKCKAIESDEGEETFYLIEGDDSVIIFLLSTNPNCKVKKILLN
jgi:hypothetical protein